MSNTRPRFHLAALVAMLLWGAAATVASAEDLIQELKKVPYKIIFESYRDQNWDLFMVRADGSERVNLTRTPDVNELCPHVSADGTKVCFAVDDGEGDQRVRSVWSMNLDGTGRRLVARGAREPCWAAGDRGIVYLKNEFEKFTAMDYATKGLFVHDLASGREHWKIQHIDWSPDGRYVAFSRGPYKRGLGLAPSLVGVQAPGWDICVADPSATNRWVAITTDGNSNKEPDWVPIANERR